MDRLFGWVENGAGSVQTAGQNSSNNTLVQRSFPGATVTVYDSGSSNLSTIYSDNNGTPLANPFTANNNGYYGFYAASGKYTVQFSGGGISGNITLPDIALGAVQTINNQSQEAQFLVLGGNGSTPAIASANGVHTFNFPNASANSNGVLLAVDWSRFNNGTSFNFTAPLSNNNGTVSLATPLAIAYGGTAANSKTLAFDNLTPQANKGDLVAFDGNNAIRLPVGSNGQFLVADGTNNSGLAWAAANMNSVAGVLPIANGGTNATTATGGFANLSPLTTKGDLISRNATVPVRLGVGTDGFSLVANSANSIGLVWSAVSLSGVGVTGILPIANGGTGANSAANAFTALAPITTKGDLITANNSNVNVRLPVGANDQVLTANSANSNGLVWATPTTTIQHFTISYNNNAFVANAATASLTLFTLGQYQKISGATVKHSASFTNNNNSITDVTFSLGYGGNAVFYTANQSVGNATAPSNTAFQDTSLFKSSNMGANTAVLATFVATGGNFGNGASTVLVAGNLDVWVQITTLQ